MTVIPLKPNEIAWRLYRIATEMDSLLPDYADELRDLADDLIAAFKVQQQVYAKIIDASVPTTPSSAIGLVGVMSKGPDL